MAKGASGSIKCGFCMTGDHKQCKAEIKYFDKVWLCTCAECHPENAKEKNVEEPTSED